MFGISFLIALMIYGSDSNQLKKPHIVLLIADDLVSIFLIIYLLNFCFADTPVFLIIRILQ